RKFSRIRPARLEELLGERGPAVHAPEPEASSSTPSLSGDDAAGGDPPVAPPVS
ncbi:MAG: Proteasome subunit alpha, partial [Nocardioides sp.]|nr:Proteasome subunit alpha [Nocardioides sp.]